MLTKAINAKNDTNKQQRSKLKKIKRKNGACFCPLNNVNGYFQEPFCFPRLDKSCHFDLYITSMEK